MPTGEAYSDAVWCDDAPFEESDTLPDRPSSWIGRNKMIRNRIHTPSLRIA